MMNRIIKAIMAMLDGILGNFIGAFLMNWEKDHAGDNQILDLIAQLVGSANQNALLDTGDKKYQWVFDQAVSQLATLGKTLGTSMLNTLIELAVQNLDKAMSKPAGS